MKNIFVTKIGGSLLYNLDLTFNENFLKKLITWFERSRERYDKIVIVVGGGKISRHIGQQVGKFTTTDEDQHRIGMQATVMNAEIIRSILAEDSIIVPKTLGEAMEVLMNDSNRFIVAGGFKAGWSTDMSAAVLANIIGEKKIHKLSNIDHIYTKDPANDPTAVIMKDIKWEEYFDHFGILVDDPTQKPNENTPIGAVCAKFAMQKGLSFFVSGGKTLNDTERLEDVFEAGSFVHP